MAQESSSIELQALSQPDDEPFISDKQTTWPQSLSRLKFRLPGKKITSEDWKKTLYLGSASTVVVLMFNVGFVLWAAKHRGLQDNQGILFSGGCEKSKKISMGFHLVINILGTILLGASSYGMQCLCAPTRGDIDRVHSRGKSLDIGVQSMRNLWRIPRVKLFLWICLAFSSLPLHLVYNSTIFQTLSVYKYHVLVGSKPFSSFNVNDVRLPRQRSPDPVFTRLLKKDMKGGLQHFNNRECISNYATGFQTNYASLLLVTDGFNSTIADFANITDDNAPGTDPYRWMCAGYDLTTSGLDCTSLVPKMLADPDNWTIPGPIRDSETLPANNYSLHSTGLKVKYCLGENVPERCTVEYSLPLVLVVIIVNVIKAVILWWITIAMANTPILTTGDAVSSFIKTPDDTTKGRCLLSRDMVIRPVSKDYRRLNKNPTFHAKPRRWGSPVSGGRWTFCVLLCSISIFSCIMLLGIEMDGRGTSQKFRGASLGEPNASTLINGLPSSLVANTIIVNIPQAVFSVLYFSLNGIYTLMALANEWSYYALKRKGLRVSMLPQGSQRSTYFLSLPYRYSIPLLTVSGVLHWLLSQSLYLVSIKSYGTGLTREPANDTTTCGYSPPATVSAISVGGAMVACLVLLAFKQLKSGMPVAGSCSMAIAAACHPSLSAKGDDAMEETAGGDDTLPLKWGVEMPGCDGVAHCAFSSEQVEFPLDGCVYE